MTGQQVQGSRRPSISVVMPVYNAEKLLPLSLAPLFSMLQAGLVDELIVVDDCSTDRSRELVSSFAGIRLLQTPKNMGPGGARNLAASVAGGDYLWFVDSDVVVLQNAGKALQASIISTGCVAVFGCYDSNPAAQNFLSQYKNLVHRYYHRRANEHPDTFWAGCGAVRRKEFLEVGGFDVDRYKVPSIEDIELGYRLTEKGYRIVFNPELQGTHLKVWRFVNLIHTEVFRRAIPWSRLMFERKQLTNDLNVGMSERLRAGLSGILLLVLLGWVIGLVNVLAVASVLGITMMANAEFIVFFARLRGVLFALRAFMMHQIYYLYSSAAFAYALISHGKARIVAPTTAQS